MGVALLLVGLDLFFGLVNELRFIGRGHYRLFDALGYLLRVAPTHGYELFPWAALVGTLLSLGLLASHHELVILRAAGISVLRISASILKAALVVTAVVVLMGEMFAPLSEHWAQNNRAFALNGGKALETGGGLWVRQGTTFVHVQAILDAPQSKQPILSGVTRYQLDEQGGLQEAMSAEKAIPQFKRGRIGNSAKVVGWQLEGVRKTTFFEGRTEVAALPRLALTDLLDLNLLQTAHIKHPERLPLSQLWRTLSERTKNGLDARPYGVALWSRIYRPVIILLMVGLAIPFIFGPLRSATLGLRITVGILVVFAFHGLNTLFVPLAMVYHWPPLLAVVLPSLLFMGVGLVLLKQVR